MAEEKSIGAADMEPSDPDVTSTQARGEDIRDRDDVEPGRQPNVGTKGESERPFGTSDVRDSTGVNPEASEPTGSGGPAMPAGDQAG